MPSGIVWQVDPATALEALAKNYRQQIERGVLAIANTYAPQISEWMKQTHPWQNRTGDAEKGLYTEVNQVIGSMTEIILSHGNDVSYGIWLEVANASRWGIINPAIDYWGPRVWAAVVRMLS